MRNKRQEASSPSQRPPASRQRPPAPNKQQQPFHRQKPGVPLHKQPENKQAEPLTGERLARFMAHAGVASRRHAEDLIAAGRVKVNGEVIKTQGARIDPAKDQVVVNGVPVQALQENLYILLHKPAGYVTTAKDPQGRPTVVDLLPRELRRVRVYPVGRLDIDTSGLLLLTNDGDFALRMTHPRYSLEKHYKVLVQGRVAEGALESLSKGVVIQEDDNQSFTTSPAQARILRQGEAQSWLLLTIHEGHKRQVRRMLASVGYTVLELQRIGIGSLRMKDLPEGGWRYLNEREVATLLDEKVDLESLGR